MRLLTHAIDKYRQDGITDLLLSGYRYIGLKRWVDNQRGYQKLSVGNITAKFGYTNRVEWESTWKRSNTETRILLDILSEIHPTDIFFDIGANTDLYTCFIGRKLSSGVVHAFEPYPPNVEQLKWNIELNGVNAEVWPNAVSNEEASVQFDWPEESEIGYGEASISVDETKAHEVRSISIDHRISQGALPTPDVIKIDVEGGEPLVLRGMMQTLQTSSPRLLYCEFHIESNDTRPAIHGFGATEDELVSKIQDAGYDAIKLEDADRRVFYKFEATE